jgi:hypothetical protein
MLVSGLRAAAPVTIRALAIRAALAFSAAGHAFAVADFIVCAAGTGAGVGDAFAIFTTILGTTCATALATIGGLRMHRALLMCGVAGGPGTLGPQRGSSSECQHQNDNRKNETFLHEIILLRIMIQGSIFQDACRRTSVPSFRKIRINPYKSA